MTGDRMGEVRTDTQRTRAKATRDHKSIFTLDRIDNPGFQNAKPHYSSSEYRNPSGLSNPYPSRANGGMGRGCLPGEDACGQGMSPRLPNSRLAALEVAMLDRLPQTGLR